MVSWWLVGKGRERRTGGSQGAQVAARENRQRLGRTGGGQGGQAAAKEERKQGWLERWAVSKKWRIRKV